MGLLRRLWTKVFGGNHEQVRRVEPSLVVPQHTVSPPPKPAPSRPPLDLHRPLRRDPVQVSDHYSYEAPTDKVRSPSPSRPTLAASERSTTTAPAAVRPSAGTAPQDPYVLENLSFDVLLKYQDAKGDVTDRHVTVRSVVISFADQVVTWRTLTGYCHLRKMARTFRADRIVDIADADTGEIWPDMLPTLMDRCGLKDVAETFRKGEPA